MAGRADEVRTFKGTANSGKPFGYGGTQTVVDFEGLRHKASVPVLLEHSPLKMAGVCRLSVTADGLIAEGSLLSNEFGTQIAEAADQGFPWEMSVYVQAESFEMLEAGASLTVNGGEVHGPAVVMTKQMQNYDKTRATLQQRPSETLFLLHKNVFQTAYHLFLLIVALQFFHADRPFFQFFHPLFVFFPFFPFGDTVT